MNGTPPSRQDHPPSLNADLRHEVCRRAASMEDEQMLPVILRQTMHDGGIAWWDVSLEEIKSICCDALRSYHRTRRLREAVA